MSLLRPDLCIIGAGAAGLSVAAGAAALGVSAVLIEKGDMGGECLNHGCVPSKALLAAARRAQDMRRAADVGLRPADPVIDASLIAGHLRRVREAIAPADSAERYRAMGVNVIRAPARFVDLHKVEAGGFEIAPRRFVIATGSRPVIPSIPGLDLIHFHTNETIFSLASIPERLAIIGGGATGCELAQAFSRLGSQVWLIEPNRILAREEAEFTVPLAAALAREGVRLHEGYGVARIDPEGEGAILTLADGTRISASHVLIAVGRRAHVEGLGLEAGGIAHDARTILVGADLRTSNPRAYAIGDCAGAGFTQAAAHQASLVLRSALFRAPITWRPETIPRAVFTDPEYAAIGLSEDEARAKHGRIRVLRAGFSENDRARTEGAIDGHVKLVTASSGKLLGGAILGRDAAETIPFLALALSQGLKARDLAGMTMPYPTLAETLKRAAVADLARHASRPFVRKAIRFLRVFG